MRCVIDDAVAEKMGLSPSEILALMIIKTGEDFRWLLAGLLDKEVIIKIGTPPTRYMITKRGEALCNNILLASDTSIPTNEELESLAEKLIAVFPEGKKPGTPYYWKCNKREVMLKLKSFFKLYGRKYTEEQIVNAAKEYVEANRYNSTTMRILKYFIWKKVDGEEVSDLATYIDNAEQDDELGDNWITELK